LDVEVEPETVLVVESEGLRRAVAVFENQEADEVDEPDLETMDAVCEGVPIELTLSLLV
jgi:hypothetical protein